MKCELWFFLHRHSFLEASNMHIQNYSSFRQVVFELYIKLAEGSAHPRPYLNSIFLWKEVPLEKLPEMLPPLVRYRNITVRNSVSRFFKYCVLEFQIINNFTMIIFLRDTTYLIFFTIFNTRHTVKLLQGVYCCFVLF